MCHNSIVTVFSKTEKLVVSKPCTNNHWTVEVLASEYWQVGRMEWLKNL